jgi:tetratricopeptide (TPR) repeat protein
MKFSFEKLKIHSFLLSNIVALSLGFSGCSILKESPIPLHPFPIHNFAPEVPLLPDTQSTLSGQLQEDIDKNMREGSIMTMRGGRGIMVKSRNQREEELLNSLPSSQLKVSFLGELYIPPPNFDRPKAGDKHYYNFKVTKEFAKANDLYLTGQGDAAVEVMNKVLADNGNEPALLWQTSYLKVMTLIMMGQVHKAEQETAQTERLEIKVMGKNVFSRALRAEVRYWAGDMQGASLDAAQVLKAIGDWRLPTSYGSPPKDQTELANVTTGQVRASIILGLALLSKGYYQEALPWLRLANQTMNNVLFVNRHPLYGLYFPEYQEIFYGRGMALLALGTNLLILDPDSKEGLEAFDHAHEYFSAMGYQAGNVIAGTFKTNAYFLAKDYQRAVKQAENTLELAEKTERLTSIWRLELLRGKSLLKLGHQDIAEKAFRHAQSIVDLLSGTMVSDEAKIRFGTGKEAITQGLVDIDLKNENYIKLFEDMERGRARAFVSMLATKQVGMETNHPEIKLIKALDADILAIRQRKNSLTSSKLTLKFSEKELLLKRNKLVEQLRQRDSELADTLSVSTVDLKLVQETLEPNKQLVYFLPTTQLEKIRLLVITKERVVLKELSITEKEMAALIKKFMVTVRSNNLGRQKTVLNDMLLALAVPDWLQSEAVYVVPSGSLHFIPWGALEIGFPVAVLPTGGWVSRVSVDKFNSPTAVIVGDPEFGGLFPQLPGAREETIAVAKNYGSSPLTGKKATEQELRKQVGQGIDVLHLATHALFDPIAPLQSSLLLTDGENAVPLTAEALFRNPLKASVVVLSACETGMGEVIAGDDLLGLTRSFYLGGSRVVVSSLWPVEDNATRSFMEIFHKESRNGNYGLAWLRARDELKQKGYPPASYGAFVLGGSFGISTSSDTIPGHL